VTNDEATGSVELTLRIAARPETVWKYWTESARLGEWWGSAELVASPGGVFRAEVPGGPVMTGQYVEIVPYERIVFTFGWEPGSEAPPIPPGSTHVEVTLLADGNDTMLTLRHTEIPRAWTAEHRVGWERVLPALVAAVEQR
jgi:uncharacterized protein YndB with AHSA1/START domain